MVRTAMKLLKVLNSESEPSQISLAVALSMVAGLTPLWSLHNSLVFLLAFVLRVNLSAFFLGLAFFSGIAYLADGLFHRVGLWILTGEGLKGLWTSLYASPLLRIERFNNTIVMGSLASSLALFCPLLLALNLVIRKYRQHIVSRVGATRIAQMIKASKIYETYRSLSGWEA